MRKLQRAGLRRVTVLDARPMGIDDLERYPLFPPALIARMRAMLSPERQRAIARSVVFVARKA